VVAFLEKNELGGAYKDSTDYTRQFQRSFDELERLADNRVRSDLPANYPRVNDGSMSALLGEVPMRIWAQLQTGRVVALRDGETKFQPFEIEIANVVWANKIVPFANTQAPFFSKLQTSEEDSFTYGSMFYYAFSVGRDGRTGADFMVVKPRDVKFEPGKVSDLDSDYMFLDTYYTRLKIKGMLAAHKQEKRAALEQNRPCDSKIDEKMLQEILDGNLFEEERDAEDQSSEEASRQSFSKTIKFVTCFHRGFKAPFYTFVPKLQNRVIRTTYNTNRTGDIPLSGIYYKRNLKNPYGKGQVEQGAPTQNALDFLVSAHMLGTQQGLEPPVAISGDTTSTQFNTIGWGANERWILGAASAEVKDPTTAVYKQFGNSYGLYKTQLMNHLGTGDNSVSATAGNPQYSKTPQGVNAQEERKNAKDNYLRQRVDEALVALAKNLLNMYFANMHGSEFVEITAEQREKLVKAGMEIPEGDEEILVEYEKFREGRWSYDVDANSSMVKNDEDTKNRLVEMVELVSNNPNLKQDLKEEGKIFKMGELFRQIFIKSGLDDWDKIIVDMTPEEIAQFKLEQQAATQATMPTTDPNATSPPVTAPTDAGAITPEAADAMPDAEAPVDGVAEQLPEGADPAAIAELQQLLQQGLDEPTAHMTMLLRRAGWTDEQITQYLSKEGQA
jgi:hypothetical protein